MTYGFSTGGIDFWWYDGPQDTLNYPMTHSHYNYQWYSRKILRVMEQYPDKYFIWWTVPPMSIGNAGSYADEQAKFNAWMVDSLQAGLDSYGTFPENVYIFDIFSLLETNNIMPNSYADASDDAHANADAASYVAPIYIQQVFDKARAYRRPE